MSVRSAKQPEPSAPRRRARPTEVGEHRATVRLLPAPVPDPPYDDPRYDDAPADDPRQGDRRFGRSNRPGESLAVQGSLALDFVLPSGLPVVPRPTPRLRIVGRDLGRTPAAAVPDELAATRPHPGQFAAILVQAAVEVVAGDRPLTQMTRWTSAEVYEQLQWRRRRPARPGLRTATPRALVTSVHVYEPRAGIAEACATVRRGGRVVAVALRLEADRQAWRCTALELR